MTKFDDYLKKQMQDTGFAEHFESAGEDWDIAIAVLVVAGYFVKL